jgi:peroxiredoxin
MADSKIPQGSGPLNDHTNSPHSSRDKEIGGSPSAPPEILRRIQNLPIGFKIAIGALAVCIGSLGLFRNYTSIVAQNVPTAKPDHFETDRTDLMARQKFPDFKILDETGTSTTFSSLKGKVVILSFWAGWSSPCLQEISQISKLAEKYHDQGLVMAPINVDKDQDAKITAKEFLKKKGIKAPNYIDTGETLSELFKVGRLPAHFVFDRQGAMVFSSVGANDWSNPQLIQSVQDLLAEPATQN